MKSDEVLKDYPYVKFSGENPFLPNGLVNDHGELQLQDDRSPEFKIEYVVKAAYGGGVKPDHFCWESIAFALYFPENCDQPGEIEIKRHKVMYSQVNHVEKACHIAQLCHGCHKRICPDIQHECRRRCS